jgi:putative tricarboxylic transport membrane protein
MLSIIGSYSINNSVIDIYWMFFFGIIGYFFKMYDYPVSTLVLGVILGPIIDTNWRRAVDISHGNLLEFFGGFFTNPISLVLLLFIVFMALPAGVRSSAVGLVKKPFIRKR